MDHTKYRGEIGAQREMNMRPKNIEMRNEVRSKNAGQC